MTNVLFGNLLQQGLKTASRGLDDAARGAASFFNPNLLPNGAGGGLGGLTTDLFQMANPNVLNAKTAFLNSLRDDANNGLQTLYQNLAKQAMENPSVRDHFLAQAQLHGFSGDLATKYAHYLAGQELAGRQLAQQMGGASAQMPMTQLSSHAQGYSPIAQYANNGAGSQVNFAIDGTLNFEQMLRNAMAANGGNSHAALDDVIKQVLNNGAAGNAASDAAGAAAQGASKGASSLEEILLNKYRAKSGMKDATKAQARYTRDETAAKAAYEAAMAKYPDNHAKAGEFVYSKAYRNKAEAQWEAFQEGSWDAKRDFRTSEKAFKNAKKEAKYAEKMEDLKAKRQAASERRGNYYNY